MAGPKKSHRGQRTLVLVLTVLFLGLLVAQSLLSVLILQTPGGHPGSPGFSALAVPVPSLKKTLAACGTSTGVTTATGMVAVSAGDSIVLLFELNQPSAISVSTVTDTAGDTVKFIHAVTNSNANGARVELWVVNNSIGNANNRITASWGTSDRFCLMYVVTATARNYAVYDAVGAGTTNSNATCQDTVTTSKANDLLLMGCMTHVAVTGTKVGNDWIQNTSNAAAGSGVLAAFNATATGTYTIQATMASGQWAGLVVAVEPPTVPGQVTALAVSARTTGSLSYTWTNPTGGGLLNDSVYRWTSGSCSGTVATTSIGSAAASNTQSGLAWATTYSTEVAAWNITGTGAVSSCVSSSTLPGPVTSLSASAASSTSLSVTWSNPNGTLSNDSIWWGTSCSSGRSTSSLGVVTSTTLSTLSTATTYCIAVRAYVSGANGGGSIVFTNATTKAGLATGLTVGTVTTTTIPLSWSNPSGTLSNVTGYQSTNACVSSFATSLGVVTSATFSGLSSATKYCLGVQVWSSSGNIGTTWTNGTTLAGLVSGISETGETLTTASISWTNPSGTLANVTVKVGLVCGTWTQSNSVGVVTSYTITTLVQATTYCVGIQAWSSSGNSGTVFANVTTLAGTATSLSIGTVTTTTIALTWTLSPGILTNVTVLVGTVCNTWIQQNSMGSGSTTSYTVTGLTAGTTYCVAIREWNIIGPGGIDYNNGTTLPVAQTGLAVTSVTTTTVSLSWSQVGSIVNDSAYYGTSCSTLTTHVSLGVVTSATLTSLSAATKYCIETTSWSSGGHSAPSFVNGTTIPTASTGLTVGVVTTTSIALSWSNSAGTLLNSTIYRWTGSSCSGTVTATSLGSAGTSNTQSGLAGATTFAFEVVSWSGGGSSAVSSCVTGSTLPGGPTSLTVATVTVSTIGWTWVNPSGTLTNSSVYRWLGASCSGTVTTTSIGSPATSNTQTGLAGATQYSVEVAAWSSGGSSAVSSCVQGTTLPAAVTSLTVGVVTSSSIPISWSNPSGTLANLSAFYGTSCGALSTHVSLGITTSATLGSLLGATKYCVEMQAWSSSGHGAPAFTNGTTLPGPVTSLVVSSVTTTQITMGWSNPTGTITNDSLLLGTSCGSLSSGASLGVATTANPGGLNPATTYCLTITAWSSSGAGAATYVNGTTLPSVVTGLVLTAISSTSLGASWINPAGSLVNLTVTAATGGCGSPVQTVSASVVSSYTLTGLTASTSYCVGVQAWSAGGGGGVIYTNGTTLSGASLPKAPTNLALTSVTTITVGLSWKNPAGSLTKNTIIYGFTCLVLTGSVTISAAVSYTITSLAPSTTYCFEISATNSTGMGPYSSPFIVATSASSGGSGGSGGNGGGGSTGGTGTPSQGFQFQSPVDPTVLEVLGVLVAIFGAALIYPGRKWAGVFIVIAGAVLFIVGGML